MKEKKANLQAIQQGICPKCHKKSIKLIDKRSTSCGGPKLLTFECRSCDYVNTFNVDTNSSCSSGSCGY